MSGFRAGMFDDAVNDMVMDFGNAVLGFATSCIEGAFTASISTIDNAEWSVATGLNGKMAYVMTVVAVAVGAVEIAVGALRQNMAQVARAVILVVLAWPVTLTVTWLTIQVVGGTDQLTGVMMSGASTTIADGLLRPMLTGFGAVDATTGAFVITASSALGIFGGLLVALTLWIVGTVLSVIMAFRAFGILVLVAALPVAFMVQSGGQAFKEMRTKWIQLAVALALTKPLAALIVLIATGLLRASSAGSTLAEAVATYSVGLVGLIVACAAPKLCSQFVAFAGGVLAASAGGASISDRGYAATKTAGRAAFGMTPLGQRLGFGQPRAASKANTAAATSAAGGGSGGPRAPQPGSGPSGTAGQPPTGGATGGGTGGGRAGKGGTPGAGGGGAGQARAVGGAGGGARAGGGSGAAGGGYRAGQGGGVAVGAGSGLVGGAAGGGFGGVSGPDDGGVAGDGGYGAVPSPDAGPVGGPGGGWVSAPAGGGGDGWGSGGSAPESWGGGDLGTPVDAGSGFTGGGVLGGDGGYDGEHSGPGGFADGPLDAGFVDSKAAAAPPGGGTSAVGVPPVGSAPAQPFAGPGSAGGGWSDQMPGAAVSGHGWDKPLGEQPSKPVDGSSGGRRRNPRRTTPRRRGPGHGSGPNLFSG